VVGALFHTVQDGQDTDQRLIGPLMVVSMQPVLGHVSPALAPGSKFFRKEMIWLSLNQDFFI
jgi:hypothetical protein